MVDGTVKGDILFDPFEWNRLYCKANCMIPLVADPHKIPVLSKSIGLMNCWLKRSNMAKCCRKTKGKDLELISLGMVGDGEEGLTKPFRNWNKLLLVSVSE